MLWSSLNDKEHCMDWASLSCPHQCPSLYLIAHSDAFLSPHQISLLEIVGIHSEVSETDDSFVWYLPRHLLFNWHQRPHPEASI